MSWLCRARGHGLGPSKEALQEMSRAGQRAFAAAHSCCSLADMHSRNQDFPKGKSAPAQGPCRGSPCRAFSPGATYSSWRNCIPCQAWKVPLRIRVRPFPERFLGREEVTHRNRACPTERGDKAGSLCRKGANPRWKREATAAFSVFVACPGGQASGTRADSLSVPGSSQGCKNWLPDGCVWTTPLGSVPWRGCPAIGIDLCSSAGLWAGQS